MEGLFQAFARANRRPIVLPVTQVHLLGSKIPRSSLAPISRGGSSIFTTSLRILQRKGKDRFPFSFRPLDSAWSFDLD